ADVVVVRRGGAPARAQRSSPDAWPSTGGWWRSARFTAGRRQPSGDEYGIDYIRIEGQRAEGVSVHPVAERVALDIGGGDLARLATGFAVVVGFAVLLALALPLALLALMLPGSTPARVSMAQL